MECVKAHFTDFTEPCKAALVRIAVVRESCGADINEQCPAIKPGGIAPTTVELGKEALPTLSR